MRLPGWVKGTFGSVLIAFASASPAWSQIEDQISSYTGINAEDYLKPLMNAFGADLSDGLFYTADISRFGLNMSLEVRVMGVIFGDEDRYFDAVTEGGFSPRQTAKAPTVVGPEEAVVVYGDGGTAFAFPGGFNLHSFAIAVPQLRIGSLFGTEALLRYFTISTGDTDIGDLGLFGFGLRHSLSQYFGAGFPVDIAAGFFWQRFRLGESREGEDLISTSALSIGAQASGRFAKVFVPYTGLSWDSASMEVKYETGAGGEDVEIELDFERDRTLHWTMGMTLDLAILKIYGEYNIADQNSYSFGGGVGFEFGD